jgi:hypothetical protein
MSMALNKYKSSSQELIKGIHFLSLTLSSGRYGSSSGIAENALGFAAGGPDPRTVS